MNPADFVKGFLDPGPTRLPVPERGLANNKFNVLRGIGHFWTAVNFPEMYDFQ
jgi:hypothetical protein